MLTPNVSDTVISPKDSRTNKIILPLSPTTPTSWASLWFYKPGVILHTPVLVPSHLLVPLSGTPCPQIFTWFILSSFRSCSNITLVKSPLAALLKIATSSSLTRSIPLL